jgi:ABC-2 type transport system permease protein
VGWAIMMPLMMLGGGMIPLFIMPSWLAQLSSVSPVKWGILALEGAIWRNFSAAEMALPLGILIAVGVVGLWFGARRVAARAV